MDLKILLVFVPLLGWALGDFYIQKTVRKVSIVQSLFYICFATVPLLLYFIYSDLLKLTNENIIYLSGIGLLVFYLCSHPIQSNADRKT